MTKDDPTLRIKQIDAEMVEIQQEIDRVKNDIDPGSSRTRAELHERMQQLKAEQNKLIKDQEAAGD